MSKKECPYYREECPVTDCLSFEKPEFCALYAEQKRKIGIEKEIDDNGFLLK